MLTNAKRIIKAFHQEYCLLAHPLENLMLAASLSHGILACGSLETKLLFRAGCSHGIVRSTPV